MRWAGPTPCRLPVADPLVDLASARLAESALLRSMELAPAANQTPGTRPGRSARDGCQDTGCRAAGGIWCG